MLHPAANRHRKATHQCLLSPYGRPSLPFATSWGSKPAVCHAASCSQQAPQGHTTHQCLLMGVQACRLPATSRVCFIMRKEECVKLNTTVFTMTKERASEGPNRRQTIRLPTCSRWPTAKRHYSRKRLWCYACHASAVTSSPFF